MGKAFHPGRSAQNGYAAALLAKEGFTAGEHGIEGARGFAASNKAAAQEMHINFSPTLGKIPMADTDDIYFFVGAAAPGQLPVFGSEPGESNYTPIWHEELVTWKTGVTPTLLKSDTDIEKAVKQGDVTKTEPHIILNCPIVKVGS